MTSATQTACSAAGTASTRNQEPSRTTKPATELSLIARPFSSISWTSHQATAIRTRHFRVSRTGLRVGATTKGREGRWALRGFWTTNAIPTRFGSVATTAFLLGTRPNGAFTFFTLGFDICGIFIFGKDEAKHDHNKGQRCHFNNILAWKKCNFSSWDKFTSAVFFSLGRKQLSRKNSFFNTLRGWNYWIWSSLKFRKYTSFT